MIKDEEIIQCPECGSDNIFDLETKFECEDCTFIWPKINKSFHDKLWEHMHDEHDLLLLESELADIREICNKELSDAIKNLAHINDKYCCCNACKVAERFNLKN
jgi:uncharacterized Zn ribbon protein